MIPINIFAVIVATIVAFILGFLFHGPLLGKLWMKLANVHMTGNEKMSDMIPQMLWNLLAVFVSTYVLAVVYALGTASPYLAGPGVWTGIISGLLVWIGFLVTTTSIDVIWMGKNIKLWLFEAGCSLVVMIVVGAIIGSM